MTHIICLFNLRPGVSGEDYEAWAKATDLPTVRGLESVAGFEVYKATGTFSGSPPPYQYIEVIDVTDMERFGVETQAEAMKAVAAEFQGRLADNPIFILTEKLD